MAYWFRLYLMLAIVVTLLWGLDDQRKEHAAQDRQSIVDRAVLGHAEQLLASRLSGAVADLRFLAATPDLAAAYADRSEAVLDRTASLFAALMAQKQDYSQLRVLDEHGVELVRVDRRADRPVRAPQTALQNKSGRDFFEDARIGERGTVFVSRLDLSVERGQIEIPYRPTLRLSTPLRTPGHPALVLALNVDGQGLLDALEQALEMPEAQGMLIDDEGYWLFHPDPSMRWGFMLPEAPDMGHRYPISWALMQGSRGEIDTDEGRFAFQPVFPLQHLRAVSGGLVEHGWWLALYRPASSLNAQLGPFLQWPFWLLQAMVLALMLGWRAQRDRDQARREQNRAERVQRAQADAAQLHLREQLYELTLAVQRGSDAESFACILLSELAPLLGLAQGVVYRLDGEWLRPLAGYGVAHDVALRHFRLGDSLLNEAVRERRQKAIDSLPDNYLPIASALGHSAPAQLLIIPLWVRGDDIGALELGLLKPLDELQRQLLGAAIPLLALHLANYLHSFGLRSGQSARMPG